MERSAEVCAFHATRWRPDSIRNRRRQHLLQLLPDVLQRLRAASGAAHRDGSFHRKRRYWGDGLFAGETISTGSMTGMLPIRAGQRVCARFGDLATVEIAFEA